MRKTAIPGFGTDSGLTAAGPWLDIEALTTAELSSEDPAHPFEDAVRTHADSGWRASAPGPQLIRLRFDTPQAIRRIHLEFREKDVARSQEIALFSTSHGSARKELVRQQGVFSPAGATSEVEDYYFDLKDVVVLEVEIDPGRHDTSVFASLHRIRIA